MKKIFYILMCFCVLSFAKTIEIDVVKIVPVYEKQERQNNCVAKETFDENNILGTVLGSVAGGVLGSNIGGGSGKTVSTITGALLGSYAGNKLQDKIRSSDGCNNTAIKDILVGYKNIGYYNGKEYYKISDTQLDSIKIEVR